MDDESGDYKEFSLIIVAAYCFTAIVVVGGIVAAIVPLATGH